MHDHSFLLLVYYQLISQHDHNIKDTSFIPFLFPTHLLGLLIFNVYIYTYPNMKTDLWKCHKQRGRLCPRGQRRWSWLRTQPPPQCTHWSWKHWGNDRWSGRYVHPRNGWCHRHASPHGSHPPWAAHTGSSCPTCIADTLHTPRWIEVWHGRLLSHHLPLPLHSPRSYIHNTHTY